jgi:hypothetical protein
MIANKVTITPTRELIGEWMTKEFGYSTAIDLEGMKLSIAKHAAQWGADCELDACCALMDDWGLEESDLRAARRPKPAPTDEELYELWEESGFESDRFARAVLAQWGNQ